MKKLLEYIRTERGLDFHEEYPGLIIHRISKLMTERNQNSLEAYLQQLQDDPKEFDALIDSLSFNVSSFFRDPLYFEYLAARHLPELWKMKQVSGHNDFRIWSAGCAAGEEAYTMAMLLREFGKYIGERIPVTIFASDLSKQHLEKARLGWYHKDALDQTKSGILDRYFTPSGKGYQVRAEIREQVRFHCHDLLDPKAYVPRESIFGNFDLVLCRNVMIYYSESFRSTILSKLYRAMSDEGILVLGDSETIEGEYLHLLQRDSSRLNIYRKIQ